MVNAYQDALGEDSSDLRASIEPHGLNPPPPIPMDRLRNAVRELRQEKGLSINDCMMRSGLSRTATLDLLNGRGRITCGRLDSWWALAWALDVPMGELMAHLDDSSESRNTEN